MFPSTARDLGIFLCLVRVFYGRTCLKVRFMMIYDGNDDDNDEGADEDGEEHVIIKTVFVLY